MRQYPNKEYRMIRTAECVTPKHPDKMCDRIADAILTEAIKQAYEFHKNWIMEAMNEDKQA